MDYRYKISRHPISFIVKHPLLSKSENVSLNFSLYSYANQSYKDCRTEFKLSYLDLNTEWLKATLTSLPTGQELAFHSAVEIKGKTYHIPMIDLGGRSNEIKNIHIIENFTKLWNINLDIYSSGRSYHAYGNSLLSGEQWVKFMGSLLLLNNPGKSKIIDTRWVGHRLLGGYSSLRWSNNTTQYKKFPTHFRSI